MASSTDVVDLLVNKYSVDLHAEVRIIDDY